jgi:Flp pilus assembly protein TadG
MLVTIPMLICLFEMCMFCYTVAVLQYASRQGVQYAMTHGTDAPNCSGPGGSVHRSCPDVAGANVTAVITAVAGSSGHILSTSQIQLIWANNTNNPGNPVTVQVQYPYKTYSHVPFPALTINGTATGQIVY